MPDGTPITNNPSSQQPEFDRYAADYDRALAEGLSVSGEDKTYFARGRVAWLAQRFRQLGQSPKTLLDFGCGTGTATPFLAEFIPFDSLVGVDVSDKSLAVARQTHGSDRVRFEVVAKFNAPGKFDLAFCNGVFHHIPLAERAAAVNCVYQSLRPGGYFAFWENNPWNPGTRYVMSRISFDRDAITLSPPEARRLLRAGGFEIVSTDFLFYFPRALGWLRGLERFAVSIPLGAQYQVLCRKPA